MIVAEFLILSKMLYSAVTAILSIVLDGHPNPNRK
jgi:hypothetical protein